MNDKIIEKIKMEEGDKARMYKCPAGKWTIGAGINLEAQEMPQEVRDLWLQHILSGLHFSMLRDVPSYCGNPDDDAADLVLLDMAYQMGVKGLLGFKKMNDAIGVEDYQLAANELLDSNYARQTPNRANRNAELLRGCA
jgi:lysozyme